MCVNFGDTRLRDCELRHKKIIKNADSAGKFINLSITQKPLDVKRWNLNTIWVLMNTWSKPSLGAPSNETKILQAENERKVDEFEPIYLGNYWYWYYISVITDFVIFERTINHLSFSYACLPQLEYYFSCLESFSLLFFSFSSAAIYF